MTRKPSTPVSSTRDDDRIAAGGAIGEPGDAVGEVDRLLVPDRGVVCSTAWLWIAVIVSRSAVSASLIRTAVIGGRSLFFSASGARGFIGARVRIADASRRNRRPGGKQPNSYAAQPTGLALTASRTRIARLMSTMIGSKKALPIAGPRSRRRTRTAGPRSPRARVAALSRFTVSGSFAPKNSRGWTASGCAGAAGAEPDADYPRGDAMPPITISSAARRPAKNSACTSCATVMASRMLMRCGARSRTRSAGHEAVPFGGGCRAAARFAVPLWAPARRRRSRTR